MFLLILGMNSSCITIDGGMQLVPGVRSSWTDKYTAGTFINSVLL